MSCITQVCQMTSNNATVEIINASHLKITGASGWKDSNKELLKRSFFYVNYLLVGATDGSHGELKYLFVI